MANKIQEARAQVAQLTQAAYEKAVEAGKLPAGAEVKATIEIPKDAAHGDYASSYAMAGAKALRMAPRAIAQTIVDHLDLEGSYFQKVEIAGPGFLNFTLGPKWYKEVLADVEREGAQYGANTEGHGEKVMVEFVSANPTGPMHMGNARGGVLGDTLANVLKRDGCDTWKEFYVNDAGNQIHKFAMSIDARYLQILLGEENVPFPEEGYKISHILIDIRQVLGNKRGYRRIAILHILMKSVQIGITLFQQSGYPGTHRFIHILGNMILRLIDIVGFHFRQ